MKRPVLFCHYGKSDYMEYAFSCIRKSNPKRDIILLGDEENKKVANQNGLKHVEFKSLKDSKKIKKFENVYQLIDGKNHVSYRGGRDWVNFVFKRWFFVEEYIKNSKIKSFWHFDSDYMVFDNLSNHVDRFTNFDCTYQCDGSCMNGYISGTKVVEEYTKKINDLFQRENYLNKQREEFENENPDYAFTEMRAFLKYMEEEKVNIGKLAKVSDGKRMDDFLSCRQGFDSEKLNGKEVKKIEMREGGRFFGRMEGREVEIASTDLSFLPVKVFKIMHDHYISDKHVGKTLGEAYNPNIYEKGKIAAGRFLESLGFDLKGS